MVDDKHVFQKTYEHYLEEIRKTDLKKLEKSLGIKVKNNEAIIPFFGEEYRVSGDGLFNKNNKLVTLDICVILSKYILLCPENQIEDKSWTAFRDFKDTGPLTVYFDNNVEKAFAESYSGNVYTLKNELIRLGGFIPDIKLSYDLAIQINALPKISLLLLFNDEEEGFPPGCSLLFEKRSEKYLDGESLAILGAILHNKILRKSF